MAAILLCLLAAVLQVTAPPARPRPKRARNPAAAFHAGTCDDSLWNHVYHGVFPTAKARLKVIDPCITVTGTVADAFPEADGDWHVRLRVDPQFQNLLNARNVAGEKGFLVAEPVCEQPVTQADTLQEGVCANFHPSLYQTSMLNKHVSITGAYIEDESKDHGWREIHPVSSISVIP